MNLSSLGSGYSSVGGYAWFLVGADHERAFWVTRSDDMEAADLAAYEVRDFQPGTAYADSLVTDAALADEVAAFCTTLSVQGNVNFSDLKRARDLYWSYRLAKPQ